MPTPKNNEGHKEFIDRCIPYVIKEGTAKDGKQGRVVCESIWEKHTKREMTMETEQIVRVKANAVPEVIKNENDSPTFIFTDERFASNGHDVVVEGIDTTTFASNPVMLWSHNAEEPVIGNWENFQKVGHQMTGQPNFATGIGYELADIVAGLVDKGFLKACSIGIQALRKDVDVVKKTAARGEHLKFNKSLLYECSIVNIPGNSGSLTAALNEGTLTKDEMTVLTGFNTLNVNEFDTLSAKAMEELFIGGCKLSKSAARKLVCYVKDGLRCDADNSRCDAGFDKKLTDEIIVRELNRKIEKLNNWRKQ